MMRDGLRSITVVSVLSVIALLLAAAELPAQDASDPDASPPQSVRTGLYVSPPFVMEQDGDYSGLAVELWEHLAETANLQSDYRVYPTLRDLVQATSTGEVDVAVTNLTVTQNRARRIDFTHPWYDAGLRIMINQDRRSSFAELISGLRDAGHLRAYAWLAGVIVAATLLLTLFDRCFDKEFPRNWREGLAESFYAVMSITTSGKAARKNLFGWAGRIWSALWLVCGVAVLAYVTSTVTSVMTSLSLTSQIHSADDLPGKTIGVFTGSVAEEYARDSGIAHRSYDHVEEAAQALLEQRISAVVGDAPVLEYYAHTHADDPLDVVGPLFERDKYAFGLHPDNELTKLLTVELLGAYERGMLDDLRTKYFGDSP